MPRGKLNGPMRQPGSKCTTRKGKNGKITKTGRCTASSTARYGMSKSDLQVWLDENDIRYRPRSKKSTLLKKFRNFKRGN